MVIKPMDYIVAVGDNISTIFSSYHRHSKDQVELMLYNHKTNTIIDSLINYNDLKERKGSWESGQYYGTDYPSVYFEYRDEVYYMNVCSDTLYRLSENEIAPFVVFDFGEDKYNRERGLRKISEMGEELERMMRGEKHRTNSILLGAILRTSDELYMQLRYNEKEFVYALNFESLKARYCKPYFINDLDNGPNYSICEEPEDYRTPSRVIDVSKLKIKPNDKEYKWHFPNNKIEKKMQNIDQFQQLFDKATEESNPIIQILKLKE